MTVAVLEAMSRDRKFGVFGKETRVGNPILIKTTYDEDEIDRLPDVREVKDLSELRDGIHMNPAEDARRRKRISDAPTASSIYTEPSPKFRYDFEHDPPVLPLFAKPDKTGSQAGASRIPAPTFANELPSKRLSGLPIKRKQLPPTASPTLTPSPPQPEVKASTFAERAAKAGVTGLGTSITALRPEWNGASGRSAQMTPIADHPSVTSGSTGRASYNSKDDNTPVAAAYSTRSRSPMVSPLGEEDEQNDISVAQWRQYLRRTSRSASPTISPTSESGDDFADNSARPWTMRNRNIEELTPERQATQSAEPESPAVIYKFASPVKQSLDESVGSATRRLPNDPSDSTIVPVPRRATEPSNPPEEPSTPVTGQQEFGIKTSSTFPSTFETPPQEPRSRFSWTTHATSAVGTPQARPSLDEPAARQRQIQSTPDNQPKSRFSWTTMDTSPQTTPSRAPASQTWANVEQQYYDDSSPPQVPSQISPAIMARRRPFPPVLKRKPAPPTSVGTLNEWRRHEPEPAMSIEEAKSKPLPTTPTVLDSVDTVTTIQANLEDLAIRRHNLKKLISSLSDPLNETNTGSNPMVVDLAKRRQMKDRVQKMEEELWEVITEERELGLKLHRSWKRREKNLEPSTGLWVRRVTK